MRWIGTYCLGRDSGAVCGDVRSGLGRRR
jgi:hypothetical protein